MRKLLKLTVFSLVLPGSPLALTPEMSCADYLKLDQQISAQLSSEAKAALQADPQAAALDGKMREYCRKNPKASTAEAAEKVLLQ
jgi:hypothetical protein